VLVVRCRQCDVVKVKKELAKLVWIGKMEMFGACLGCV